MQNSENAKMPGVHHLAEVNGVRMYFTLAGQGEPVVLLHGSR